MLEKVIEELDKSGLKWGATNVWAGAQEDHLIIHVKGVIVRDGKIVELPTKKKEEK